MTRKESSAQGFSYNLDDLIFGKLVSPQEAILLDLDQIKVIRADVQGEILNSDKIKAILAEKIRELIQAMTSSEGGERTSDDELIKRLLSPEQIASLSIVQLRILAAQIRSEVLFSEDVLALLAERVKQSLSQLRREGKQR